MKFLVDNMLGRLGKWLRILGYDTLYLSEASDNSLVKRAVRDKRILLTRDQELFEKAPKRRCVLIKEIQYLAQLKETVKKLKLKPVSRRFFTICLECNQPVKRVYKAKIQKRVPEDVYRYRKFFWKCPKCKKIFWKGSHYENTLKKIRKW